MAGKVNPSKTIDYETFMSLQGPDLVAFMEPRVSDATTIVPMDVAHRLVSELLLYDEYHLVYALLLLSIYLPSSIVARLPDFLCHPYDSVQCTALNILDRISDENLTRGLVDSIHNALTRHSSDIFGRDVLGRLEQRLLTLRSCQ